MRNKQQHFQINDLVKIPGHSFIVVGAQYSVYLKEYQYEVCEQSELENHRPFESGENEISYRSTFYFERTLLEYQKDIPRK